MSDPTRPLPPLPMRLLVDTSPAWAGWPQRDAALAALRAALAPLVAAWHLPVRLVPIWRADQAGEWPGESVARLRLDGDGREVYVRLPEASQATSRMVADALAEGALAMRESWLSAAVLRRMGLGDRPAAWLKEGAARGLAPWRFAATGLAADATPAEVVFGPGFDVEAVQLRLQVRSRVHLDDAADASPPWQVGLEQVARALHDELGIALPSFEVEIDASLPEDALRLWVNDMPLPLVPWLAPGFVAVDAPIERLRALGVEAQPMRSFEGVLLARFVATRRHRQIVADEKLTLWEPRTYALLAMAMTARRYAGALWTLAATEAVLERQRRTQQKLVETWEHRFAAPLLNRLLCRLLAEHVSIRDLRTILETMLALQSLVVVDDAAERIVLPPMTWHVMARASTVPAEPSVDEWLEQLRCALGPATIARLSTGTMSLSVLRLGPALEHELLDDPGPLAAGDGHRRLYTALYLALAGFEPQMPRIVLTHPGVRASLLRLVAADLPELQVLGAIEAGAVAGLAEVGQVG